ncbi:MAG: coenzyme F420-0:L-glutamate ligase, partial [Actinomycetota bacterium]
MARAAHDERAPAAHNRGRLIEDHLDEARIRPGDDLAALLVRAIADAGEALVDGDVLVVAQKPVSKAEGRIVDLAGVEPSAEALAIAAEDGGDPRLVEVILNESAAVVRRRGSFIVGRTRHGHVLGSSGVDRSNQDDPDHVTLLPVDPDHASSKDQPVSRSSSTRTIARWSVRAAIMGRYVLPFLVPAYE